MNRKILFQVAAPAVVTGLALVVTGLGSAWSIHRLQANLAFILQDNVESAQASLELEGSTRQMRYHSLLYLIHPTPEGLAQIEEDDSRFETAFARAEKAVNLPEEERLLKAIRSGFAKYKEEMARLRAEVARTGPRSDFARLATDNPIRHITTPCQELGRINLEQLEGTVAESNALSSRWRIGLVFLSVVGPLGGLIAGYGITRGLTRSITKLRVRVRDVVNRLQSPLGEWRSDGNDDLAQSDRSGVQLTLTADGDLAAMEQQLDQVVARAEEMMERLQTQQAEILRSEQLAALGQLAASVAHEVRNPLTGMKLLVEVALRPYRPQPLSREDLEVIHGEITRLEETVRHFLDFARPQPLVRRVTDLREVASRPVDLVRARARQQGVRVRVELPAEPLPADLDAGQLESVLVNLLLNALDALPRGGEVTVEAGNREGSVLDGRTSCFLSVRDNGPGIAKEVLPRLFTPFASGKPTGTGLGLSLARRVVEQHGGQIGAANLPAGGACFTILLPQAANTDSATASGPEPKGRGDGLPSIHEPGSNGIAC